MTGIPGGILDGIRVLELAQNAAIPHCGRLLAGLGADVVKVEPPEGDAMRGLAQLGPGEAKAYAVINPGKRSIAVDLGAPDAREILDALFRWADVAIVAFKGPDLARFGIDWEHARTINPRLVHLTHTPFGPEGPDADQGGYDALVQGRSGVGFVMNRSADGVPQPTRPAVNDFGTGMLSAFAVLAGLRHRDQTGEGQRVDTSLLGTAMSLGTAVLGRFDASDPEVLSEFADDLAAMRAAGVDFDTQRE
ncbi:MAG: CoA transferase, partial [Actinomycetota bacterium]